MPGSGAAPREGLAIIDEQATVSMVDPRVADWFRVNREAMPTVVYSLSTMEGQNVHHDSRALHGMEIEPLGDSGNEGDTKCISLPPCIESRNIPGALDEIPDREDVKRMQGLEDLAARFPRKKDSWETLLLLGRNCGEAMGMKQFINRRHGTPMAVHTPLG